MAQQTPPKKDEEKQPAPPAQPPTGDAAQQTPPKKADAAASTVPGVTPALLAYVAKTYPGHTILQVGQTQMIIHDGDLSKAGVKVALPDSK